MSRSSPVTESAEAELKAVRQMIIDFVDSGAQDNEPITVTNGDLCRWFDRLEIASAHLRNGHAQTPADTYRETVRKVAAARERRLADAYAALRSIAEGNLGDASWQANYETIKQVARNALAASPDSSTDREENNG